MHRPIEVLLITHYFFAIFKKLKAFYLKPVESKKLLSEPLGFLTPNLVDFIKNSYCSNVSRNFQILGLKWNQNLPKNFKLIG